MKNHSSSASVFTETSWPWLLPEASRATPSGWAEIYALSNALWEFYGVLCRAHYVARNNPATPDLSFLKNQWLQETKFDDRVLAMSSMFRDSLKKPYRISDLPFGWVGFASEGQTELEQVLNEQSISYECDQAGLDTVTSFLKKIQPIIEEKTLSYWSVANVRPRVAVPGGTDGMHSWHKDGTPHPLIKILCYIAPQNAEEGTTEIEMLDGTRVMVAADRPGWLMFNPGVLMHRGVAGREKLRPIVEIMLLPALKPDMHAQYNGLGANYPWFPILPETLCGIADVPLELPSLQFQQIRHQFAALIDKYLAVARRLKAIELAPMPPTPPLPPEPQPIPDYAMHFKYVRGYKLIIELGHRILRRMGWR